MKHWRRTVVGMGVWVAIAGCGGGDAGGGLEARASVGGATAAPDLVVWVRDPATLASISSQYGLTLVSQFGSRPIYRLRPPAGVSAATLATIVGARPGVVMAEPNLAAEAPEARRVSVWAIGGDAGTYASHWAPQALGLASAHAVSTGSGVRVAVLDTGADLVHPALAGAWARDAAGHVIGRDFVDGDADPSEAGTRSDIGFGHGTHVAGIVALTAPGARIMPVRVLDAGGRGNAWVLAEALQWSLDPDGDPLTDDGAHIVTLSLGTTQPTGLLKAVTDLATCQFDDDADDYEDPGFDADRARCQAGQAATVVAAAGNDASDSLHVYPAAEDVKGVLAVTAHTAQKRLASFANWGGWIGIAAPGEAIVSTVPGGYGTWSGTSMAAPFAAGTAALVMATPAQGGPSHADPLRRWTPENLTKRLTDRAGGLCNASVKGLSAHAAVRDVQAADASCP
jgi:subtilisin family serine protease